MRRIFQGNISRGTITVDRNCWATKFTAVFRRLSISIFTNLDLVQKGLAVGFNFLAQFGSSSTYCLPLRRPSGRDPNAPTHGRTPRLLLREFHPNPHRAPAPIRPIRVSPGPIPAGIRDKAAVFLRLLLSFAPPAPGPLFLFDSAGRPVWPFNCCSWLRFHEERRGLGRASIADSAPAAWIWSRGAVFPPIFVSWYSWKDFSFQLLTVPVCLAIWSGNKEIMDLGRLV